MLFLNHRFPGRVARGLYSASFDSITKMLTKETKILHPRKNPVIRGPSCPQDSGNAKKISLQVRCSVFSFPNRI